ncbi:MAG: EAL domain-containing protein, partial [Myxococcota bacterium]
GTLRRFPLDALKIDRSCIAELTRNPDASLAQAIIAVAKALSLKAVAVGVEEPKQLEILRDLGCDQAQGHLFSRALPFEALVEWSGNWEATTASPVMQTVADSLRGSSERR